MGSSDAKRFLELLQVIAIKESNMQAWVTEHRELSPDDPRLIEELTRWGSPSSTPDHNRDPKRIAAEVRTLPDATRYETWATSHLINGYVERLNATAERLRIDNWPSPVFGSLHTGQVNAMTILVPGSTDYIIAFETGMFQFIRCMSKCVVEAFSSPPTSDPTHISQNIRSKPDLSLYFGENIVSYVSTARLKASRERTFNDNGQVQALLTLDDSASLFVMGHEFGHAISGHLSKTKRQARALPASLTVEELAYSWQQEYEADQIGTRIAIHTMLQEENPLAASSWGIDLFFGAMDIVERTTGLLSTGREIPTVESSHPASSQRRAMAREALIRLAFELGGDVLVTRVAIELGDLVVYILEELWNSVRPAVLQLHQDGLRPASSWRLG